MSTGKAGVGTFEKPEIRDYGTLLELTAQVAGTGPEDGGDKARREHHTDPSA